MKVCDRCGACYDDGFDLCAYDGEQLAAAFDGSRVLGDRYRLDARLAGGGMGVVYRATHLQIGSTVAVKLMHLDRAGPRRIAAARFHREAQILGQIKHPNAVLVTDFGVERRAAIDVPYLVTEFLNGEPLSDRIAQRGRFSIVECERIISPLCEAVEEAHRIGVVHRDIKPSNVFLERVGDGSEIVKVLDFGIAKFVVDAAVPVDAPIIPVSIEVEADDTHPDHPDREYSRDTQPDPWLPDPDLAGDLTLPGAMLGTLRYMAPEQLAGEPITPRTDVYAIATLTVRLLTGDVPVPGSDEVIIRAKLRGERPALKDVPPKLADVLAAAFARDPSARPQNARAIAMALRESAISRDAPAVREPSLALAVQIGAISALIRRLNGDIESWAAIELDEVNYRRARDQLLALDLPLSKVVQTIERCPTSIAPNDASRLTREIEDFDEAVEDMTRALRTLPASGSEYVRFLSVLGSRQTASAAGISRRMRQKLKLEDPHVGSPLDELRTPRQSRLQLEDLTHRLLSTSALETADAIDAVLIEHLDLVREHLSRPDARDPLLGDLVLGLWRHVDAILLRELFPVTGAPGLLPELAGLGIAASEPFSTIAAVFAAPRRTATAEWVRARFAQHGEEIARASWRCALVHPIAEVREAAVRAVPRAELWTAIAYPKTPLAYERAMLERLLGDEGASPEHLKIFFLCARDNLAAAETEAELAEAFRVSALLAATEAMRDEIVFESFLQLDGELRAKCARAGVAPQVEAGYADRLAELANRGAAHAGAPSGMSDIPLAIQREVARRGGFISFYISHTIDAIARETLPHLLRLDDVTHYLMIPTINRSVLLTLARKRHYFRKESARLAILHNPKTPAQTARIFLPFLSPEQLRHMVADRAIGADVRQLAEQYLQRAQRKGEP